MKERADFDVLIIGSGLAGAMSADRLIHEGLRVGVIDVGIEQNKSVAPPRAPFRDLRERDAEQKRYFIGKSLNSASLEKVRVGAQLTPPREFITEDTEKYLPYESQNFFPLQSLALGGLAAGWGTACFTFSKSEMAEAGIPAEHMVRHYNEAASRIGVSGDRSGDSAEICYSALNQVQAPLEGDANAESLLQKYHANRAEFRSRGFSLGRSCLAVLSSPLQNREANPYHDMDFWSDGGKSAFRPAFMFEELKLRPQFTYLQNRLAIKFREVNDHRVAVHCRNTVTHESEVFYAKRLVVCAGAINSARLVMNSLHIFDKRTNILCNPYTYIPCVNWDMFGRRGKDRRHSFAQLFGAYEEGGYIATMQFYSYRSLLLFKLIKEIPLPVSAGLLLARTLVESLVIAGVHHPDRASPAKYIEARDPHEEGALPLLRMNYERSEAEARVIYGIERNIRRTLRRLRCIPLRTVDPGNAGSIHYAGTLPYGKGPLTTGPDEKLFGTKTIFIGDSAPWKFLPAKGLGLTIMANARRVAERVLEDLKKSA